MIYIIKGTWYAIHIDIKNRLRILTGKKNTLTHASSLEGRIYWAIEVKKPL